MKDTENKYWVRLYPNKKTKPTQPDYYGEMRMEGNTYSFVGWNTKDKNDKDCINCKVKLESGSVSGSNDHQATFDQIESILSNIGDRLNKLESK